MTLTSAGGFERGWVAPPWGSRVGEGVGGLHWSAVLPLVVKGEEGRPWFAGAGWRPTATMAAMEGAGGREG